MDDVSYPNEGAFQDGVIAQAVNTVKAAGALFFSSAGNSGRLDAGTSGTWEGDFVDSGTAVGPFAGTGNEGLPIHSFNGLTGGSAANSDQLTASAPHAITLKWADPLGGAATDYDLFVLDSTLTTVEAWSDDDQSITLEPFETMGPGAPGERILVVLWSGPPKALRLDTHRGRLTYPTAGAVYGHNGGDSTVSVAAVNVSTAGGGAFTGGAANPIETYSSDGPRKLLFNPNGSEITPGNILFATGGGRDLQKPDITAADCVTTTTPGFRPFCGTSAAAPHATAMAAPSKSVPGNPSVGQALAAMLATALDVHPAGWDQDGGVGIAMAYAAVSALSPIDFYTVSPCRIFDTRVVSGPTAGAPLTCGIDSDFTMVGGTCGVPSGAKAIPLNVTVTEPSAQGHLRLFASGAPPPFASNLSYIAGQTRANNAISSLSSAGQVAVKCSPSGTVHVIVDVNGYFQ